MAKRKSKKVNIQAYLMWGGIGVGSFIALIFLLLIVLPYPRYTGGFATISDVAAYGKTVNEEQPLEGKHFLVPEYTKYYKSNYSLTFGKKISAKFGWLLHCLWLKGKPYWTPSTFVDLLKKVVKKREKNGWTGGKIIKKIAAKQGQKFVVFGNIQGAFHSLTRDLVKLKELKLISDKFKLSPDVYMIFLGSYADRTSFALETHTIMLRLMQENPENIIFIRGNCEYYRKWSRLSTKDELVFKAGHLADAKDDEIPFKDLVNKYYETLPVGFYVMLPATEKELPFVRFSGYRGLNEKLEKLEEPKFYKFLKEKMAAELDSFDLAKQAKDEQEGSDVLSMKAVVGDIYKRKEYEPMDGLRLLPSDRGAAAWTVLSCPTLVYQKGLKFFYDAFAVVTAAKDPKEWRVTLYKQDVRKKDGFKTREELFIYPKDSGDEEKSADKEDKEEKKDKEEKADKKKDDDEKKEEDKDEKKTEKE